MSSKSLEELMNSESFLLQLEMWADAKMRAESVLIDGDDIKITWNADKLPREIKKSNLL